MKNGVESDQLRTRLARVALAGEVRFLGQSTMAEFVKKDLKLWVPCEIRYRGPVGKSAGDMRFLVQSAMAEFMKMVLRVRSSA